MCVSPSFLGRVVRASRLRPVPWPPVGTALLLLRLCYPRLGTGRQRHGSERLAPEWHSLALPLLPLPASSPSSLLALAPLEASALPAASSSPASGARRLRQLVPLGHGPFGAGARAVLHSLAGLPVLSWFSSFASPPAFSGRPLPRYHVEVACAEGREQHLCAYEARLEPRPGPHRQVGRHGISFFGEVTFLQK